MPLQQSDCKCLRHRNAFEHFRRYGCFVAIHLLLMIAAGGCAQGVYRAGSLPLELAAPRPTNAQSLDLSALAQASPSSRVIQPRDLLEISISTGLETEEVIPYVVRVDDNGVGNIPLIGPIRLAGLELSNSDQAIRNVSIDRKLFKDPNVSVVLKQREENKVTVLGEVKEPDTYSLPVSSTTLLAAIVAAGGLTKDADTIVEVRRPGSQGSSHDGPDAASAPRTRVDLLEATTRGGGDVRLGDGSVVMVMKKDERSVYVLGLVKNDGQYDMPEDRDLRLLAAISMAGGRALEIADKVKIIRTFSDRKEPVVITASIRKAKKSEAENIRLAPGDIISLEETPTTFAIQTVRDFVRFGLSAGVPLF